MRSRDLVREAVWAIRAYPLRHAALMMSLAIGMAAITFSANVLAGFSREIERLAFGAYAHALVIRENGLIVDQHGPPRAADIAHLSASMEAATGSAAWLQSASEAWVDGERVRFDVYGVQGRYADELDTEVASGRRLTPEETAGADRICLIGSALARNLDLVHAPAVIRIRGVSCEVVGILEAPHSRPAERFTNAVIAPLGPARHYFADRDATAIGELSWLTVFLPVGYDMRSAEMEADIALRAARGVPQSRPSPFIYGDPNATLVQQAEQRRLVSRLLLAISILTVLGSLTGYVAIAMAILSARKREIALRMAIGADARDIRTQILFESASAGLVAGLAGWLLGAGLSFTTAGVTGWTVVIEWTSAPTALGPALLVGLGIGVALAGRFAKLSPSLAARS